MDENRFAQENEQNTPMMVTAAKDSTNKDITPMLLSMKELIWVKHPIGKRLSGLLVSQPVLSRQQELGTDTVQSLAPWMPQQFKDD